MANIKGLVHILVIMIMASKVLGGPNRVVASTKDLVGCQLVTNIKVRFGMVRVMDSKVELDQIRLEGGDNPLVIRDMVLGIEMFLISLAVGE